MTLELGLSDSFADAFEELWEIGPSVIAVVAFEREEDLHERRFKITVVRPLAGGKYWSAYEEELIVVVSGTAHKLWVRVDRLAVSGDTAEDCLRDALEALHRQPED